MTETQFKNLERVFKEDERNRILGMIEFYISTLEDSTPGRTAKRLLETCIKTIERN